MFIFYSNKYALNAFEVEFYFRCKCKGMQRICVFVYLQEGKNHEKQFLQSVFNDREKQLLQDFLHKSC